MGVNNYITKGKSVKTRNHLFEPKFKMDLPPSGGLGIKSRRIVQLIALYLVNQLPDQNHLLPFCVSPKIITFGLRFKKRNCSEITLSSNE
jgi:hypothetical protein